jgi:hypothetical protein
VELRVPVPGTGPKHLKVRTAKSFDYGIFRFSVDGRAIGRDLDTYSANIVPSDFVELGAIGPRDRGTDASSSRSTPSPPMRFRVRDLVPRPSADRSGGSPERARGPGGGGRIPVSRSRR